jgi:hypothetical protein
VGAYSWSGVFRWRTLVLASAARWASHRLPDRRGHAAPDGLGEETSMHRSRFPASGRGLRAMSLSAVAFLIALGAFGSAAAQAAVRPGGPHATPACGRYCFDLSSLVLGPDLIQNADIRPDNGTGGRAGQTLNLATASNTIPDEDFTIAKVGDLADFCGSLISATSYACLNYPKTFPVYESNWSPFGNQSGLCAGVRTAGRASEPVTLQDCGATARTLWVTDLHAKITSHHMAYFPWVNASDPDFSHPLVLTADQSSARPADQLKVDRLNTLTGGVIPDTQQFTMQKGPAA